MIDVNAACRSFRALLGVLAILGIAGSAAAQAPGGLERSATLRAEDVLPPALLRGPHHTVDPTVHVYSLMREYRVQSEFGSYVVVGDARLRILVRELSAIAELRRVKRGAAFVEASANAVAGTVRGARNLVEDPVGTLSGVPEAAADIFGRIGEQLNRGRRSRYEDGSAKALLSVSSFKRDLARSLGVDVYSTNELLQKELNSVAWASAAGNLSLGALSMATGAAALQVAGYVRVLDQAKEVIASEPPAEISRRSRASLTAMAMPKDVIDRFLAHRSYSPRHQYLIVSSLQVMDKVADRRRLLDAALLAQSEAEAHLFQQTAEMMAAYHQIVQPLGRISADWGFPVGVLPRGKVVVLAPVDYVLWSDPAVGFFARLPARAARAQVERRGGSPAAPHGEVWISGDASPRARDEIARLGYALHVRSGDRLPLAD